MENGNGNGRKNGKILFGEYALESELQTLRRGGEDVHLARRPFDVLLFLIENRDRVVNRAELLEKFWNGQDVYDDALRKCVGVIRKALDDEGKTPRFIETRRGAGYRFIGTVADEFEKRSPDPENQLPEDQAIIGKIRNSRSRARYRQVLAAVLLALSVVGILAYLHFTQLPSPQILTETPAARPSIAILPLKNLTGDAANDYLSDGITESLINEISRVESLKVISRSSAFQFKDKNASAQEIGEKLGVETILEGGLKQSGEQLRVEVRLVNVKDGSVIWTSDSEQKKMADIFTIQDGIACQIVAGLRVKLCGEVLPVERYTQNVKAYQLYLQGLYYRNRLGGEDLKKAIDYFSQALKAEPKYALAHEGLASTYAVMELNAMVPPGTVAALAEDHARQALALDDSLANAYLALGVAKTIDNYDLAEREKYYRQALQKNPNHRTAHLWLANNFTVQGKFAEAEAEILRAQEIDPLSYGVRLQLAELYWYWHQPGKAIEQANLMLLAAPGNQQAYSLLARAYAQQNDFEKSLAELEQIPSDDLMHAALLTGAGRTAEAQKYVDAFLNSDEAKNSPYKVGCLYAIIGEKDKALDWLEKSYQLRQADLVSMKIDPALDNLRDEPRYQELLRRIHLAG